MTLEKLNEIKEAARLAVGVCRDHLRGNNVIGSCWECTGIEDQWLLEVDRRLKEYTKSHEVVEERK